MIPDTTEEEMKKLGIKGVHRQQIFKAFPNKSVGKNANKKWIVAAQRNISINGKMGATSLSGLDGLHRLLLLLYKM